MMHSAQLLSDGFAGAEERAGDRNSVREIRESRASWLSSISPPLEFVIGQKIAHLGKGTGGCALSNLIQDQLLIRLAV